MIPFRSTKPDLPRKRLQKHRLQRRPNVYRFGQHIDQSLGEAISGWGKSPIERHLENRPAPLDGGLAGGLNSGEGPPASGIASAGIQKRETKRRLFG